MPDAGIACSTVPRNASSALAETPSTSLALREVLGGVLPPLLNDADLQSFT